MFMISYISLLQAMHCKDMWITRGSQYPLDLEPALEVMYVPCTDGDQHERLQDGPPLDSIILRDKGGSEWLWSRDGHWAYR